VTATVREGDKGTLLVVDVQAGVMGEASEAQRVIKNVARTVERARDQGVPVIWVQHSSDELPPGSELWQWVPELKPTANEARIDKQFESSFEQTKLEEALATIGATRITLASAMTNWCNRATAYAALDRGYDVTLVTDAHTTSNIDLGNGKMIEAANVVAELNIAMTWLRYPRRTNGTATTETVDFQTSGGTR